LPPTENSKNKFGAESSCVKFQERPYKANHSEYLQNVVFLIDTYMSYYFETDLLRLFKGMQ